ncbi:hypothetical protein AK812_SmicGene26521 [Symbiodinium microadriaticum]|uniref:Uncharacterized protein n=1 Tax=Symbiodinium microadriaticum TaxID=2951 RepID=A0A1Q9D9B6_SYMMI|nr:hypothetical protein AK812_SmicGene26521 [Symbiodinium microadriaticum]
MTALFDEFYGSVESLTNHHLLRDAEALHLHAHRAPRSVGDMLKRISEYDYSALSSTDRIWMLARNPYSRVLSLYLHKVVGLCKFGSLGCKDHAERMKFAGILGYNASAPPAFSVWVDLLARVMVRLQAKEVMVLRLEEQWRWFEPLVALLSSTGLSPDSLSGHLWTPFTGLSCFYAPTGNCSDSMTRTPKPPLVDHIHGTGASDAVGEHYTPQAAFLIRRIYESDFNLLGYEESPTSR